MGLIDDLKGKAQGLIHGNEQAIKNGISKAGDFVDTKTGGKYSGHVDKIQNGASKLIDKNGTPGQAPAAEQVPPVTPVNPVPPADRTP
ncbi:MULTISPECIES: antitoxin [unclassified Arthrobacter]|uniref:antitoxin n=1 Tax=unclassified Arthrobacter TaxID=235627 RepID=UPI0009A5C71B|nr:MULTISPECIES: antitoxin [unclassified Arthrobacter]MDF2049382.1 antitoxin [Arthrobacter sp. Cr_A7]RDV10656.1 antitoxin [Arthrobacter sp. RT-1]SLK04829.1 MT0933-like antitoxin protein [Arthrobacter sp. P2b]